MTGNLILKRKCGDRFANHLTKKPQRVKVRYAEPLALWEFPLQKDHIVTTVQLNLAYISRSGRYSGDLAFQTPYCKPEENAILSHNLSIVQSDIYHAKVTCMGDSFSSCTP